MSYPRRKQPETFIITEDHLKLLQRLYMETEDDDWFGVITSGYKRPFGNSDIASDMADILGIEKIEVDGGEEYLPIGTSERMRDLFKELGTALQICLVTQKFEVGTYQKSSEYDRRSWVKCG